jgi:hypothetical protein
MCVEKNLQCDRGSLKMVSLQSESSRSGNCYVINIHSVVHKCWLIKGDL